MRPLFRTGFYTRHPAVRLMRGICVSRYGVSVAFGDFAFGFTWGH